MRSSGTTTGQVESVDGLSGGSISFEYDGDLVIKVTNVQEEVSGVVEWTYDNALRTTILDVNSKRVNYYYDGDGALTRFGELRLTRDATTGFVTNTMLRSVLSTITVNGYGELDNEHFTFNANDLFEIQHTYNNMGQITDRIETLEGVSKNFAYTYDDSDRLTEVFEGGNLVEEFTFDTNDNVTERKINGVTTIATFDEQDRLISRGTKLYRYNDHGQLNEIADNLSGDLTNLNYDVFGSLRQVSTPDGTIVDYIIDVNGRRVGKRVNGVFDKGWVYSGGLRPIAEVDAAGLVTSLFGYGSGIGPDYMVKGGMTYRIITDHLGSVRQVVNATSGVIEQKINYDVYGKKTLDTNPGFQPFGYAGGLHDVDTGFVQFSARDYDPESGRWMAKDPAGFGGESPNFYTYVNGDAINYIDPSGRVPTYIVEVVAGVLSFVSEILDIFEDSIVGDCDDLDAHSAGAFAGPIISPQIKKFRVKFHAQGGDDVEYSDESVIFNQNTPVTKKQALRGLWRLKWKLTKRQFEVRKKYFKQARNFVRGAGKKGTDKGGSFQNRRGPSDIRVDIDNFSGFNFID